MKISNASLILKKAVTMCKSKTGVLASRLLVLASLRRRMATADMISHKIHALVVAADHAKPRGDSSHKVEKMSAIHGGEIANNLSHQLALLDQEGSGASGCHDWTLHPIFNDDGNCCYIEWYQEEDDDEPPVIDMIRSNKEVERLELNMDDDIDQAAEMFIRRFREQMNR